MHFSAKEKQIINKIANGVVHDLSSYISEMVSLKEEKNTWGHFIGGAVDVRVGDVVKIVENDDALSRELSIFIALCYKLQSFQLLQILDNTFSKPIPLMLTREANGAKVPTKIMNLFSKNTNFEIIPYNELSLFIYNNFATNDEVKLIDERNAREKAQKTTIIVAIISLLISTATSVGVTYFNFKTYSTERKVSISNLDAIKYPIPVSIIEVPKQVENTTQSSIKKVP